MQWDASAWGVIFHADSTQVSSVFAELFSGWGDYIDRPTHDRLAALRQASWVPERGVEEARRPGSPPLFILVDLSL